MARSKGAMRTFVALMRGINVGSTRKLPMAELRALCDEAGLRRAETYIQSGNLIVDATGEADDLRRVLEKAIAVRFGFAVDVIVRPAATWKRYEAANPFARDKRTQAKMLHLYLSRDAVNADAAAALLDRARHGERIVHAGGALWIDYGDNGAGKSKLSPALIDKACGSPTTGRNWISVQKIGEMIQLRR